MQNNNYSCIAIGNFDGIHKGHDILLRNMVEVSHHKGFKSIILTFRYSDSTMKKSPDNLKYITSFDNKINQLKLYDTDEVDVIELDSIVSHYSPEKFITEILLKKYNMKHVFVGYNFKFGYKASGNTDTLKILSNKFDYEVHIIDKVQYHDVEISSTLVRRYISEGNINEANSILKDNYTIFNNEVSFIDEFKCIVCDNCGIIIPCDGNYPVMIDNISCNVNIKTDENKRIFTFDKKVNVNENIIFLNK